MATRKLSTYRRKRDFTKTREPSGKLPVKPSKQLRYVIQKHAARSLHFDLRLELDGVFRSWAVTRGPSVNPQDKRLAVEVEDHSLDYGDFEGTIPQGEYGGKGLHVVAALAQPKTGKLNWQQAKAFAQGVCAQMAQDSPDRYVINMSKKLRTGKIFLDYLRNDRMSTAVAPYSPRAREGATVSMPLTWQQVKTGLDPQRYTLRTVPSLIPKSSAWQGYCDSERPLEPAIRKLMNAHENTRESSRLRSKHPEKASGSRKRSGRHAHSSA